MRKKVRFKVKVANSKDLAQGQNIANPVGHPFEIQIIDIKIPGIKLPAFQLLKNILHSATSFYKSSTLIDQRKSYQLVKKKKKKKKNGTKFVEPNKVYFKNLLISFNRNQSTKSTKLLIKSQKIQKF